MSKRTVLVTPKIDSGSTSDPEALTFTETDPTNDNSYKNPRENDFGIFRINGAFSDAKQIIEELVSNGYSVTVTQIRTKNEHDILVSRIDVMYTFKKDYEMFEF